MKINNNKHSIVYLSIFLLSLLAFFYLIFFTDPKNLPVFMLLIPVILIFLIFFLIFYWLIRKSIFSNKIYSVGNSAVLASVYSIIPVLLLVLASTKEFTFRDVAFALVLFILTVIYFSRVDFMKKNK
jgi:hypothetical protein